MWYLMPTKYTLKLHLKDNNAIIPSAMVGHWLSCSPEGRVPPTEPPSKHSLSSLKLPRSNKIKIQVHMPVNLFQAIYLTNLNKQCCFFSYKTSVYFVFLHTPHTSVLFTLPRSIHNSYFEEPMNMPFSKQITQWLSIYITWVSWVSKISVII